jgi:hypothetical protein
MEQLNLRNCSIQGECIVQVLQIHSERSFMGKVVVTFQDVIELNHLLEGQSLAFKVHLHDACAGQSFSVESLGNSNDLEYQESMKKAVTEYFAQKRMTIQFAENNKDFYVL